MVKSIYQRIHTHWNLYKITNTGKHFLLIKYFLVVLIYRKIICHLLGIPLFLLYIILFPFIKLRFIRLVGGSIGHYTMNTECVVSELTLLKEDKFINLFYLENSLLEPSICNFQLHKMWERILIILPLSTSPLIAVLDKYLMYFFSHKAYGMYGKKVFYESRGGRDIYNYLKKMPIKLSFTSEEQELAKNLLAKINIKSTDKYICLLVRSSAYNKNHPTWDKPERNAELSTYMKACYFLAEKGYYVLRMGKAVDDVFTSQHPRMIDYGASTIRSDFLDIYLSAHCFFFMTTGSGLDGVAQIFRRPILYTNCFVPSYISCWYPHYFFLPKLAAFKGSDLPLTFKENFRYLCDNQEFKDPPFNIFYFKKYLERHNLYLIDNTEDEILEITKEMEAKMTDSWSASYEAQQLQDKFWNLFPKNAVNYVTKTPLHGDIFIKIGSHFLKKYELLLA